MRMPAALRVLDRSPRRIIALPATLRYAGKPLDVEIADLSATGFLARVSADLQVGSEVTIGWAGDGRREAVVVRGCANEYAFEFRSPLSATVVNSARVQENVVSFGVEAAFAGNSSMLPEPHVEKFPGAVRVALITGLVGFSWCLVWLAGRAIYTIISQ